MMAECASGEYRSHSPPATVGLVELSEQRRGGVVRIPGSLPESATEKTFIPAPDREGDGYLSDADQLQNLVMSSCSIPGGNGRTQWTVPLPSGLPSSIMMIEEPFSNEPHTGDR